MLAIDPPVRILIEALVEWLRDRSVSAACNTGSMAPATPEATLS